MAFDLTPAANEFLVRVGAVSWPDLTWCTQAEIFGYFDEAAVRLSSFGLFVSRDVKTMTSGEQSYALQAGWLSTIHASADTSQLRPTTAAELFALDSAWTILQCEAGSLPSRYSLDAGELGAIALYPIPASSDYVATIDHVLPPTITPTQTTAPINALLSDYFMYWAINRARGKESPYAIPEVAADAKQKVQLLEQVFQAYWGKRA